LDLGSIAIIALFQIDKSACPNILDYNDSATCIGCDKSPELILIIGGSSTPRPSLDAGSVTTVALCEIEQRARLDVFKLPSGPCAAEGNFSQPPLLVLSAMVLPPNDICAISSASIIEIQSTASPVVKETDNGAVREYRSHISRA
jgi:hypothetical protein